jgi:ATP-dependent Lhr-like helicase
MERVTTTPDPLAAFHPAVATWFTRTFPEGPTEAQRLGWASIANGEDTLIAAPTGSGKTLAGFLVAIDQCLRASGSPDGAPPGTAVVYVSPLRALTVDVRENLERPLRAIGAIAEELGHPIPQVRVVVRNGDTTPSARAAMLRDRPEIIVTTPESLYLLVTSRRGREMLATVGTVIVDEIHAVARDKRGAHLALTLERLDRVVAGSGRPLPTRIGLSATQRPLEVVARLLVGNGSDGHGGARSAACRVVNVGHSRALDVDILLGSDELGAVMTNEQLDEIVAMLADEIAGHRTTLVFVNTRRMAERVAHLIGELLDPEVVAAHHGSLSIERRASVEDRLRSGSLRAVVATASLELGIDVGPVDLVCQLGSPRAIATFLQRVGRADHRVHGIPTGRVFPFTRDELVECVALFGAVRAGELDAVRPPVAPLDILAQQVVAECAAAGEEGISEVELLALVRRAAPFADLTDTTFESVVALVSDGVVTGRGTRGAHLHRDRVHGMVRARRGARLTASTSGGAIPELAEYRVILEPEGVVVGSVHEDFAVEAMAGDVFLLGSTAWRVVRVEQGTVRVVDAAGAAPTIPFWLGESPARTDELADAVSTLRRIVDEALEKGGPAEARAAVTAFSGVAGRPASEVVAYLAAARSELGAMPTKSLIVFERFFDDAGGMQLVVHSPFGGRVNRGLGLALRKRFCRSFDFELQAAANDDAIVLSLGPQHSFALEDVSRYLAPESVAEVLTQAVLPTPIFASRWRWNLGRSLVSPRFRGARHLPPAIQRMEADDLMAAIFPALAACGENVSGPIAVPDHPIVRQTLDDCFSEAMDLPGLTALVGAIRSGAIAVHVVDTTEASVLAHEILNGRPYTFLDDAPLEERRTRAVTVRRGIPLEAHDLSQLPPEVVRDVVGEIAPDPRNPDELHDLLCTLVVTYPIPTTRPLFDRLVAAGRATRAVCDGREVWVAFERCATVDQLMPGTTFAPGVPPLPEAPLGDRDGAIVETVRGHLQFLGPTEVDELSLAIPFVASAAVERALVALEARGEILRVAGTRWCAKRIVARIHARARDRERRRYPAVTVATFMRFACAWQHVAPGSRLNGASGLATIIGQLQGIEAAVGAWEESILPARITGFAHHLVDELAQQGELGWGRLALPSDRGGTRRGSSTPSRATPVALVRREDLPWLVAASRAGETPDRPAVGAVAEVLELLEGQGALFFSDLCAETGRLPVEIADALWDGVSRGLLTSDGFGAVRVLLAGRYRSAHRPVQRATRRLSTTTGARRMIAPTLAGGRWSVLRAAPGDAFVPDELAEAVATQLLDRWGVALREIYVREAFALPWRDVLWALRRFEARGLVRGGRFVEGPIGEQYALPEALERLRSVAASAPTGTVLTVSSHDPLNLTGVLIPGPRIPAVRGRTVTLRDGVPAATSLPAAALG